MSTPNSAPRPRPKPQRERLSSLRNSPLPQPKQYSRKKAQRCPGCLTPDIQEVEGQTACISCGTVISDSVIVNEISYGEAASGAAVVQGTTVHEGQRFAKPSGTGFRRGRTAEDHAETALREGKDELNRLANALRITGLVDSAYNLYQMARIHHFHRPRRENAAICLYIACRQTRGNTTMLIDFAEQIRCNVFDLGATYKQFLKAINLEEEIESIPLIEIEPLILKYAKRLEFGSYTKLVANDAATILARMDRDWIITGRQPAALCGACLILAARMNNFRRTIREVVYIVKAGEVTIHKRLEEFRRTKAGKMTVKQFRDYGTRLKDAADPPVFYEAKLKAERKRKRDRIRSETPHSERTAIRENAATRSTERIFQPRRDKDGFVIPELPVDPTISSSSTSLNESAPSDPSAPPEEEGIAEELLHKRRKKEKPQPIVISEEDLLVGDIELEQEISAIVSQHEHEDQFEATHARARMIASAELEKEEREKLRRRYASWRNPIPETEEIGDDEFEDDPEVANCLLTEREIEVKEKIWVSFNADWLRKQQDKMLDRMMADAMGKKEKKRSGADGKGRPKRGDGSILGESPAMSPAEASQRMIEKRAKRAVFSKHLNYEKLKKIYAPSTPSGATSEVAETASTVSDDLSDKESELEESVVGELQPILDKGNTERASGATKEATQENPIEISDDESSEVSSDTDEEGDEAEQDEFTTDARVGANVDASYEEEVDEDEDELDYDELGLKGDI